MWSDTLLAAERAHLVHLILWAACSAVLGTSIVAFVTLRRVAAPIIQGFALQALLWGTAELVIALVRWRTLGMRDVSAATRLDRFTWFNAGLDLGIVGVGLALAVLAWVHGRRLTAVGAGLAIVVQGLGLLVINLTFAAMMARLV
jgi:hypothetical protein